MIGANDALIFKHLREDIPNPKQVLFFKAKAKHIGYGGARGGGKSWAARRKAVMLCMRYKGLKVLLVRRTMPELRTNHILPLMKELAGFANYKSDERTFVFPNGSRLAMGYCDNDRDMLQYQGQENDVIFFEEATNFKEEWIVFIATTLRGTDESVQGFNRRIYYTMNPGGVSHGYFKRLFIDKRYKDEERAEDYIFIPATIEDNKVLQRENPDYKLSLEALPPAKRKAHLYGDWNVYEGQVFEEFRDLPDHYSDRVGTHVIEPFEIPDTFTIYRSMDWGFSKPFSVNYYAVDYDGRAYMILEYYGCINPDKEPNVGAKMTPEEVFSELKRLEGEHKWLRGRKILGVADPAIWNKETGISIAETGERYGIYFDKGDNKRIAGWLQIHERLKFDERGIPMLYFFKNCRNTIRTLPILQYDEHKAEDVDTTQEDHAADSLRYFCNMRPIKPRISKERAKKAFNPLEDDFEVKKYDYYLNFR